MTTQTPTPVQVQGAWNAIAARYDEFVTPANLRFGEELLGRVDPRPGLRLLDVATGSGALAIVAARKGAQTTAVDVAPAMIERLGARARAEGLTNLDGRVMDGQDLEFVDGTFDVAVSQHGVSLFPDVDGGLAEMVRVIRPGGRVLVAAFGPFQKAEFIGYVMSAMKASLPGFTPLPSNPPPPPFRLADPDVLRRGLSTAGLTDVQVEPVTWKLRVESAAHLWDLFTSSNPIGARVTANLTARQRTEVRQVLDGMLRERSGGTPGAVLHTEINVGTGTR